MKKEILNKLELIDETLNDLLTNTLLTTIERDRLTDVELLIALVKSSVRVRKSSQFELDETDKEIIRLVELIKKSYDK